MDSSRIGPYEVKEELGSGGMGTVYKAYDERLERLVAIKTILPSKELSDERRTRFRREAKAVAGLNHPAISQVYDIITEGQRDHIVMEFVHGETLAALMFRGAMRLEQAVDIAAQVAEGLAAAHEQGIIHRDLKAENIMVEPCGKVKILDFGLAKYIEKQSDDDTLTNEGMVLGTCRAMSPEQAEGRLLDYRSDLFSLGSLLYQMVTGVHPFARGKPLETIRTVVFDQPRPADEINSDLPEDLTFLIGKLLEKKPAKRPQSAIEVAVGLQVIARTWDTLTAAHSTLGLPSQRRRQRKHLLSIGIVAGVLVVVAATLIWLATGSGPPLVIAVLRPTIAAQADSERAPLAATSVRMAVLNAIASTRGLAAPDISEIDAIQGPPSEVVLAVAADEALVVDINGCQLTCQITLRRLNAEGRMLWSESIEGVPSDDLELLGNAVISKLRGAYPNLGSQGQAESRASAEDFDAYLKVRQQLDNPSVGVTRTSLLESLEEIRERSPKLLEVHLSEANTARYLYEVSSETKYLEQARKAIRRVRDQAPQDARGLLIAFDIAMAAGELHECDELVEVLKRIDPANSDILGRRARLEQRRDDSAHAIELLRRLVALRPSWRNLYRLADSEFRNGQVTDARRHLENGLERAPGNRYLMSKLAHLELVNGDPLRAAGFYGVLAESYGNSGYYSNLGIANLLAREFEKAADASWQAHQLSPENPSMMLNLADAVALSGDMETAQDWYRRSLHAADQREDQLSSSTLRVKAQCLAHLGEDHKAAAAAQAAVLAAPKDMENHFAAALTYSIIGDTRSAVVSAEQAIELGMSPGWFSMAWFDQLRNNKDFLVLIEGK
ncbi:MAG: protein kinase [Thermoanaerobaculales bacterium]|nr:protein kinase [Thermoanaerobaculales bacterium]